MKTEKILRLREVEISDNPVKKDMVGLSKEDRKSVDLKFNEITGLHGLNREKRSSNDSLWYEIRLLARRRLS